MKVIKQAGAADLIFLYESDLDASPPCHGYLIDSDGPVVSPKPLDLKRYSPCPHPTRHHYLIWCESGHSKWVFHCDMHRDKLVQGLLYHKDCESYSFWHLDRR